MQRNDAIEKSATSFSPVVVTRRVTHHAGSAAAAAADTSTHRCRCRYKLLLGRTDITASDTSALVAASSLSTFRRLLKRSLFKQSYPDIIYSTYFRHLSLSAVILTDSSTGSPVHVLMLSIQAVRGLPRLRAPGTVPCIISFSRQLPCFLMV